MAPSSHFPQTQSTRITSAAGRFGSTGLLPHTTSSKRAPNANTSDPVVGFPVLVSSGAKYPSVPTTLVVLGFAPCSYSFANPKSPSLPFISESSNTFPALTSL
uniref:Uncharacterized protein n=1 Tax=Kalanchoe fedtschenkoi TaxID=63787 RepID=A0A7N0TM69_KALFE